MESDSHTGISYNWFVQFGAMRRVGFWNTKPRYGFLYILVNTLMIVLLKVQEVSKSCLGTLLNVSFPSNANERFNLIFSFTYSFTSLILLWLSMLKELSHCHKLKFSNPYIYGTWCCRLLIFQTKIIWCNRIHSLKYLRSTTLCCRDIGIRKSEFVSKTQLL